MVPRSTKGVQEQQQQEPRPEYHRETDHISMMEVGKLLERFGKEIQQNKSVAIGGHTFPVTDNGYLEFHVMPGRRGPGTTIHFEISSGQTETPTRGNTYTAYARGIRRGMPAEFAEIVAEVGKNLANTGNFVMEDHSVALKGPAMIQQRVTEHTRQRGMRRPYRFYFDIKFGETRFPVPADEVDDAEEEQRGWIQELAIKTTDGVDNKEIAKMFESLSSDLKAGQLKVGDKTFEIGKDIGFSGLTHLVTKDDKGNRIRVGIEFGEAPPRPKRTRPRYSKEFFDEPMKKVGALLKRWGTEILETGAFTLGENEFKVKEMATYEIHAGNNGFSIELSYTEPNKEK
jgi:hypothetical protein